MTTEWPPEEERPAEAKQPSLAIPVWLRIAGTLLRTIFICTLVMVTLRVSMPQSETIWTAYDTPNDLVRLVLGSAVGAWLVIQIFRGPKNAEGYRTWLYLGLVAVPFALLCLAAIW